MEPDVSVICDRNKLDEKGFHGAPDRAVEILSPSSVKMDCERKVKLYQETGMREYWIVDAKKKPSQCTISNIIKKQSIIPSLYGFRQGFLNACICSFLKWISCKKHS